MDKEKRIGVISIIIKDNNSVHLVNDLLHDYRNIILARLGLPLRDRNINVISIIIEATSDEVGALSGKIGKLKGVKVKSLLTEYFSN